MPVTVKTPACPAVVCPPPPGATGAWTVTQDEAGCEAVFRDAQGRALGATLAGTPTAVAYPAMPVTVKTPACPAVVCPPPPGAAGAWTVTQDDTGCEAVLRDAGGRALGFALLGQATARKQALAAEVPAWLG
jgi:hypothetical protein